LGQAWGLGKGNGSTKRRSTGVMPIGANTKH